MEELYVLAVLAQSAGQDFIPVHIFPINYDLEKSKIFLQKSSKDDPEYHSFSTKMMGVFNHFQLSHQLPIITVNKKGEYQIF
jgi:hypothetical protein